MALPARHGVRLRTFGQIGLYPGSLPPSYYGDGAMGELFNFARGMGRKTVLAVLQFLRYSF